MKYLRVTKYNPSYRDDDGKYIEDEWTSFSDIGSIFNGSEFRIEDYLNTESKYIQAVILLLEVINSNGLNIIKLEKNSKKPREIELIEYCDRLVLGMVCSKEDMERLIKLILREYIWCELQSINMEAKVEFGYDYYMYFGVEDPSKALYLKDKIPAAIGLYVD